MTNLFDDKTGGNAGPGLAARAAFENTLAGGRTNVVQQPGTMGTEGMIGAPTVTSDPATPTPDTGWIHRPGDTPPWEKPPAPVAPPPPTDYPVWDERTGFNVGSPPPAPPPKNIDVFNEKTGGPVAGGPDTNVPPPKTDTPVPIPLPKDPTTNLEDPNKPATMPDPNSPEAIEEARRLRAQAAARAGRAATILTTPDERAPMTQRLRRRNALPTVLG